MEKGNSIWAAETGAVDESQKYVTELHEKNWTAQLDQGEK